MGGWGVGGGGGCGLGGEGGGFLVGCVFKAEKTTVPESLKREDLGTRESASAK